MIDEKSRSPIIKTLGANSPYKGSYFGEGDVAMNNRRHSVNGGQSPLKCDSFPALLEKAAEALSVTTNCDNITAHSEVHIGSET